ncbi:SubName: Full=Uncharacterized protein {ECO:0000313/EMBL:CCA68988.1} [Serendipita indica DSM 11827]|uniref:Uncharacterized protein n=1 Tax=Serendipita indica (strain DSM 11827) TaxID=1109443 RepID=G4TCD5_SERID|nr:SubName: Full=Uncharacterized protein {ECO:0000313/EMBL:CCA68988.1} [Serendipita indica DSM 11827]CCA68988.1 hypothetical protein PIIN_02848 [Serendipita indica DSM 11827]
MTNTHQVRCRAKKADHPLGSERLRKAAPMEASALTADRMPDGSLRALSWFGDNKGTTEALHAALGRGDTIEQRKGGSAGRGPGADFVSEHVRRVPTSGGVFILSSGQLLLGAGGVTGGWLACKAAELQRPRMGGPGAVEPYHGS